MNKCYYFVTMVPTFFFLSKIRALLLINLYPFPYFTDVRSKEQKGKGPMNWICKRDYQVGKTNIYCPTLQMTS